MRIFESHIGLINPKSPENVGAIMRAAGCYRVDSVRYTGKRYARAAQFKTDTQSIVKRIPLIGLTSDTELKQQGIKMICIEFAEGAISLPEFSHPDKALYVFGPEDGSINQSIVNQADATVYIPTVGSMNLAATVNVVLYDRLAKSKQALGNDDLICSSRDTNNRLTVSTQAK